MYITPVSILRFHLNRQRGAATRMNAADAASENGAGASASIFSGALTPALAANEDVSSSVATVASEEVEAAVQLLQDGIAVIKFGRRGKPKQRKLWLTPDRCTLRVCEEGDLATKGCALSDILELHEGCDTAVFNKTPSQWPDRCFSIVARERTFDFELASEADQVRALSALRIVSAEARRRGYAPHKTFTRAGTRGMVD